MIEKLRLRNFQAHEKLTIELDPKITTVIGPSDSGKSSIVRALKWLVFNRPSGNEFLRKGSDNVSVSISFDDSKAQRAKGTQNIYKIDGQKLEAFGSDVPAHITKALNLSEINFQFQHDSPFWFAETAGEVSRQLNKIVNLECIDNTLSNLASKMRDCKARCGVLKIQSAATKAEKDSLKSIKQMDKDLRAIEEQEGYAKKTQNKRVVALSFVIDIESHQRVVDRCSMGLDSIHSAITYGQILEDFTSGREKLESCLKEIETLKALSTGPVPDTDCLDSSIKEYQDLQEQKKKLSELISGVESFDTIMLDFTHQFTEIQEELEDKMGKECPLCGMTIKS